MTSPADLKALVERLEARRKTVTYALADGTHQTFAEADPDCQEAAAALNALMAERDEARADNVFLHQRRGELVIERDNAVAQLMEWTKGDGPNQELLLAQSNALMRAAIAEDALKSARRAAFARAKEIVETFREDEPETLAMIGYKFKIAAAIEAEMRSDEIQHGVEALAELEPEVQDDADAKPLEDKV